MTKTATVKYKYGQSMDNCIFLVYIVKIVRQLLFAKFFNLKGKIQFICPVIILLAIKGESGFSQIKSLQFERIDALSGLKFDKINDILQDDNGFIWFATNGLYKYDGISCKHFKLQSDNQQSKFGVEVTCIVRTDSGNFIVGTKNNGLYLFDPCLEKSRFCSSPASKVLLTTVVNCLLVEKDNLYIGTNAGLFISTPKCESFKRCEYFSTSEIYKIFKATDGAIWVGTHDKGLVSADFERNSFTSYLPGVQLSNGKNSVTAIAGVNDSVFFLGTWGNGLLSFNRKSNQFDKVNGPDRFNACVTRDLVYNQDGNIWIATFAEGLACYSIADDTLTFFNAQSNNSSGLTSNTIIRVFKDNTGILWIGTWGGFVCKLDLYAAQVYTLNKLIRSEAAYLLNDISFLFQEPDGTIWIASYNSGGIEITPDMNSFRTYSTSRLSNLSINAINRTSDGAIWIASCNGLNKISPDRTVSTVIDLPNSIKGKPSNSISSVYVDGSDNLWIGTEEGKVYLFDHKKDSMETFEGNVNTGYISDFYMDKNNVVWLAGYNGLFKLDREQQIIVNYDYYKSDNTSFIVQRILPANNGNLLLGTENNGLLEYNRRSNSFEHLIDYETIGAICDMKFDTCANLWLAASNGLFSYNLQTLVTSRHNYQQGLPRVNLTSVCMLRDRNMVIGGKGLFYFDPYFHRENTYTPSVMFTDLYVMDKKITPGDTLNGRVLLVNNISNTSKINLKYSEKILTLNFALLDYVNSRTADYRYKLEGFDKDWHYTNAEKAFATYTNLNDGNYNLIVEAVNIDKQLIGHSAQIEIKVIPPLWRTPWFKLMLAVVVAWLAYSFYRQKMTIKQKELEQLKNENLQAEIKRKEDILAIKNSELTSSVVHLSSKNEILHEIKRELRSIKYTKDISDITNTLNRVNANINQNFATDNNWELFEVHFNQLNNNFLGKLRKEFPELTQTNLKLCAYLRMNLSSKEIASLMNISPNAVIKSKYRLKLKFRLNKDRDLVDFISNY